MAEAVESFSDGWIEALKEYLPTKYITDQETRAGPLIVYRWLGISWVFSRKEEFKEMTKLIELSCHANLKEDVEDGLPIPDLVLGSIPCHVVFLQTDIVQTRS
jgi:hypothetical protein